MRVPSSFKVFDGTIISATLEQMPIAALHESDCPLPYSIIVSTEVNSTSGLAIVVEMVIGRDGTLLASDVYRANVCNRAKLAYNSVAGRNRDSPEALASVNGLDENLRLQERAAQIMKNLRPSQWDTPPRNHGGTTRSLRHRDPCPRSREKNRARIIIEEFMIGANVMAGSARVKNR